MLIFVFRISKTNDSNGAVEISKVIGKIKLVGTVGEFANTAYWNISA